MAKDSLVELGKLLDELVAKGGTFCFCTLCNHRPEYGHCYACPCQNHQPEPKSKNPEVLKLRKTASHLIRLLVSCSLDLKEARKYAHHKNSCKGFPATSEEQLARDCDCGFVALFGKP